MCDESLPYKTRDKHADHRDQFSADSSCIVRKSFLRFVKGHPREEYVPSWPNPDRCVYPKASAFYAFHEDTNPFTRLSSYCVSRRYGNVKPHFEPPTEPFATRDPYLETAARKKYLESEPACFVVLGKPDLNTTKLATMIADTWNCVLISPLHLVNQEIQDGSEKGRIMRDILKTGECLGAEIIMNLLTSRLDKRDVLHRGYVVEGLPLVPNHLLDYSSYPVNENAEANFHKVSQNVERLFGRPSTSRVTCPTETSEPKEYREKSVCFSADPPIPFDLKPAKEECVKKPTYDRFISGQVEDIFTTWPVKPTIIIYAICPDADAVRKREHFRTDPSTGHTVDTSLAGIGKNIEILFSHGKLQNDANISFELYQELMNEERISEELRGKYLLRRLCNRKSNVETQGELYKQFAMPCIEKWILLHNPRNVIRVDARAPVSLMFQIVVSCLRTLAIPCAILPKKMVGSTPLEFEGEAAETVANRDEFEGKTNEEVFRELTNRESISPLFPWRLSTWNFLCPVELARGRTVEGEPRFVVRFMNKVFFLSSEETVNLFLQNPRTYLFPFCPRPTCKIAVFGPKYSGKSELCKNLAQFLGGTVINVNELGKSVDDLDSDISIYSSIYTNVDEEAAKIAEAVQNIPQQEIDIEVWRDGGYVVDGMHANLDCWKRIVEDWNIIFEDVIVLFEEDPYDYLLSKWHSVQSDKAVGGDANYANYANYAEEQEDDYEEGLESDKYIRHIEKFQLNWKTVSEEVFRTCRNVISCDLDKTKNVSEYVMDRIKDRYTNKARTMTEEEKDREAELAEYFAMADGTENLDEEEEEEEGTEGMEKRTVDLDSKDNHRWFGDTNRYCPVALLKYNAFWPGKDDFSSIFMDKVYLSSSAEAREEFIRDPQKLGLPLRKPLSTVPPVRLSVIGLPGSGKSTLADAISREYGLAHVDYFECFTAFMESRGMPVVTRNDTLVSPEDLLETVELPTDLDDERFNSHTATVQTFVRQFWRSGAVLPESIRRECLTNFFKGLYDQHGIVFEQFPSCPDDVTAALKHRTMPELVIHLRCRESTAIQRTMPLLMELWENKLEQKKRAEELRHEEELKEYARRRESWIYKMLHKKPSRLQFEGEEGEYPSDEPDDYGDAAAYMGENASTDDMDSQEVDNRRFELEEIWYEENPEPVLFTDWEEFETAKRRIEQELEIVCKSDSEKLEVAKSLLEEQTIPCIVIDAETSAKDILLRVMRILDSYVRRDVCELERTYSVDPETANNLLDCGYFLFSSFGRWCPVQLHRNEIPLQMFLPLEARQEIYPVIHRQFIYFTSGKEAQAEFRRDPLAYINQDSCLPIVPYWLSIIGPPKCGKTTLARRFAEKYGLKVITRGAALRHVVKYFPWTESGQTAESWLRAGRMVPEESLYHAVETYSIDPSSIAQGFVLDGFPLNRKEFEKLTLLGLRPMIAIDLAASFTFCCHCLSQDADETRKPANFSPSFLKYRYAAWEEDRQTFREWLQKFTRNVIELDATRSKWHVWTRADEEVCSRYTIIRSYFRECDYDKVHSLKYMSVSPYEFKLRQSRFESYCPLCLSQEDKMIASASLLENDGLVQYKEHFYWICPRHVKNFAQDPRKHLPPVNPTLLQKERPRVITETIDLEHPCWFRRLQTKGFCLVTYVENLPNRRLVPGKITIGALYKDNVYLFCTEDCRDAFLTQPEKYTNITINFLQHLPKMDVKNLPCLGFLEQTVARQIIEAVNQISVNRPKLPGLSPAATAAIYLGVRLKVKNAACSLKEAAIYEKVQKRIFGREHMIKVATRTMKMQLNPFVHAPMCSQQSNPNLLGAKLSMVSRIFSGFSTSIVFRRTSPTQVLVDPNEQQSDTSSQSPIIYKVPAFLNVVDIAGLVKGAAEGQGLGNSFLSHINACDGIFHLCRAFEDDDVTHVEGDVNPVRDLEIISEELRLKDIEFLNGHLEKLEKLVVRGNDKKLKPEYDTLLKVKGVMVDEKRHIRFADWSATDIEVLNKYLFLTSKPVIYLVNLSEKDYIRKKNKWLIKIKEWVDKNDPGAVLIPFSGAFENKLIDMDDAERAKYLEENKVTSALDKIIVQGYKALQLQYFFTSGPDEVKAWTIQKGTKAPQAAGRIHTDFEKGFIMAEVMKFDDFKNEGSETAVKAAGKYRQQGRNYVVEDGDIIFFKFNAGAGLKDAKKK